MRSSENVSKTNSQVNETGRDDVRQALRQAQVLSSHSVTAS